MSILKLSLRQKIIASYFAVFLVLLLAMVLITPAIVNRVIMGSINQRADELIETLQEAPDDDALIDLISGQKYLIFSRVSIITQERKLLFDTYTKRMSDVGPSGDLSYHYPEVDQAFLNGSGVNERMSKRLRESFLYLAKTFDFHGKTYVLRTVFPQQFIVELTWHIKIGIFTLSSIILLVFGFMTWLLISMLTEPIHQIIRAIRPYQEGSVAALPEITIQKPSSEEFERLAKTLNSLSAKIQNQIDSLNNFIANASHELKTPITVIRGFAETLHENPSLPLDTFTTITGKIVRNCERMTKLVQDLLKLTDIETFEHSRLKECDLYEITHSCCEMLKDSHPHAITHLHKLSQGEFVLMADPHLLETAVMNLLENAAKYSTPPAQITVTLEENRDHVNLTVADRGIGIPKQDLEHIFERFYTVNKAHSRKMGGSGLGLSIVETIVKKHAGKISVASELGLGTTFTIHLPHKK